MKKEIKKVGLLLALLTIISFTVILLFGREYTLIFRSNNQSSTRELIYDHSKLEVIKEKEINNKYYVTIRGKETGKYDIYFNSGDFEEGKLIYVHRLFIITEGNYFGKATGSEVIPISISIILFYILYLLIKKYKSNMRDNLYQYKNISYLGIIIFTSFFLLNNIYSIFNYLGFYNTIDSIFRSVSSVSIFLLPIAIITSLLATISNIKLIVREGKSFRNLLGLFLGVFICMFTLLPEALYGFLMKTQLLDIYNLNTPTPYIYNLIESIIYLTIAYLECVLISTIVIAVMAVKKRVDYNKDYIIILGCKIRRDGSLPPLLKGRVDRALEFRNEQLKATGKDLIFIPSGGKGNDEIISEAEAIANYLIERGIDKKKILLEDKSTSTYENIIFSYKLIKDKEANICISTTNYHVLRAGMIADMQDLKVDCIGSKTKAYYWVNAFIREFVGTLYAERKRHILVFILIILFIILMIIVTYIANFI